MDEPTTIQHTPGPWTLEATFPNEAKGHKFEPTVYICGIDPQYGKIRLADIPDVQRPNDEQMANARLMVNVLDLLKAMQETAESLNEVAEELGYHNVIMDAICQLHAAIIKATG